MKDLPNRDQIDEDTPVIAATFSNLPILHRLTEKYHILHQDTLWTALNQSNPKIIDDLLSRDKELYAVNEKQGT